MSKISVINPALVHLIASEDFTTFIYHKKLKILLILPSRSVQKFYPHLLTDLSLSAHNSVIHSFSERGPTIEHDSLEL